MLSGKVILQEYLKETEEMSNEEIKKFLPEARDPVTAGVHNEEEVMERVAALQT